LAKDALPAAPDNSSLYIDSLIEIASGAALRWRLHYGLDTSRPVQVEPKRIANGRSVLHFIALALYILDESSSPLTRHVPPERSIAASRSRASAIAMPLPPVLKPGVAHQIGGGNMRAEAGC